MYRIELSPGEQTAFRSIEELAVAIRRGVVTPRARIWHNASNKWLPIHFHPHYKIAASMQLSSAELVAGPPVQPLQLLTLGELVDPPAPPVRPTPEPKPAPRRKEPPREPVQEPTREIRAAMPEPPAPKKKPAKTRRSRSGGQTLRLALAGSVVLAAAHLVFSLATAAPAEEVAARPRTHRRLISEPTTIRHQGRQETTAAAVLPNLSAVARPLARSTGQLAKPSPTPAPGSAPDTANATSSLGASSGEAASQIQPAPPSTDIAAPAAASTESLAPKVVDSTGTKALKGVLRAIAGPPATTTQRTPTKR